MNFQKREKSGEFLPRDALAVAVRVDPLANLVEKLGALVVEGEPVRFLLPGPATPPDRDVEVPFPSSLIVLHPVASELRLNCDAVSSDLEARIAVGFVVVVERLADLVVEFDERRAVHPEAHADAPPLNASLRRPIHRIPL